MGRYLLLPVEILEDVRVVVGALQERLCREGPSVLYGRVSLLLPEQGEQVGIGLLAGHDDHVVVVLGGCPDEGDASYVYLLDDVLFGSVLCDIFLERIQIHYHKVDAGDVVSLPFGHIRRLFPAVQDAAHNLGMEGLHPASEYGGISCEVLNCCNRNVMTAQILLRTPCGEYLYAEANQFICNV